MISIKAFILFTVLLAALCTQALAVKGFVHNVKSFLIPKYSSKPGYEQRRMFAQQQVANAEDLNGIKFGLKALPKQERVSIAKSINPTSGLQTVAAVTGGAVLGSVATAALVHTASGGNHRRRS